MPALEAGEEDEEGLSLSCRASRDPNTGTCANMSAGLAAAAAASAGISVCDFVRSQDRRRCRRQAVSSGRARTLWSAGTWAYRSAVEIAQVLGADGDFTDLRAGDDCGNATQPPRGTEKKRSEVIGVLGRGLLVGFEILALVASDEILFDLLKTLGIVEFAATGVVLVVVAGIAGRSAGQKRCV
ncbi:hypothetical protein HDU86_002863 [Geranomyces michiganensis]|nr:hypothetical protein HDU86_002863 [Geranomyces michiganensis]